MRFHIALLTGLVAVVQMAITQPVHADQTQAAVESAPTPVRVVYHFDRDLNQVLQGLKNIQNHLAADPTARIVVVANGKAVASLKQGTETAGGYPLDVMIEELQARGVRFEVCGNTLKALSIDPKDLIEGLSVVPSGVAELARLQSREGYAYIKP
jgi:intracellular sulfur oxidation DsrE/DsrF family protein